MGRVQIFTGDGYGKTMAALGEALIAAASGKRVVVIQFLKGRGLTDSTFERQLEPEIKIFRFEKSDADFLSLPEDLCGLKYHKYLCCCSTALHHNRSQWLQLVLKRLCLSDC